MAGTTTVAQSHRLPCTPDEAARAACLNGGTCFAWDSGGGTRSIGCSCTSDWTGNRCEYIYIDPDDWAVSYASQTIAIAVIIPIIVIFVVVTVITFLCIKKKRRERKNQQFQRTSVPPQNGSLKTKYDSPDMSASTQLSAFSDSRPYSPSADRSAPTVVWESAL